MIELPFPVALLQGEATGGSSLIGFVPLILIFAIFYFMVIAPNRKRQQALQATVAALKKGDRIVTTGGLFGEVVSVDTATVIMKIADNVKVKVAKSAIGGLEKDAGSESGR